MSLAIAFFFGVITTLWAVIAYGTHVTNKQKDPSWKSVKDNIKDIELIGSIKYRFHQVSELTERQMQLISSTERPSASAAHSRHKNSISSELKAIEQQKVDIFKSILNDGVDPQLSIVIDGVPQNMKMSEAVALFDGDVSPVKNSESKSTQRNGLRLIPNVENQDESGSPTVPGT